MTQTQEQYDELLDQLNRNIQKVESHLNTLKLQREVAQLFVQLNDSGSTLIPESRFLDSILSSPTFFAWTEEGERTFPVNNGKIQPEEDYTFYFQEAELGGEVVEITLKMFKISPVWNFSQPEAVEDSNESVQTD